MVIYRKDTDRSLTADEVDSNFETIEEITGKSTAYKVLPSLDNNFSPIMGVAYEDNLTHDSSLIIEYTIVGTDGTAGRVLKSYNVDKEAHALSNSGAAQCDERYGNMPAITISFVDDDASFINS